MTSGCGVPPFVDLGHAPNVHDLIRQCPRPLTKSRRPAARCKLCTSGVVARLLDLGRAPVVMGEVPVDGPAHATAPLRLGRCAACGVLQTEDVLDDTARELIAASTPQRSLAGRPDCARRFCEAAIDRWQLRGDGCIIEIGSGTGSLLRFFRAWQLPVLGIEAEPHRASYARLHQIPTWRTRFDATVAERIVSAGIQADLVIISTPTGAFTHLAQMLAAASRVLRPGGVLTFEVPDLLRVVGRTRFDGLRHTDLVMPSLRQLQTLVAGHGLDIVDIQRPDLTDDRLRVWIRNLNADTSADGHSRLRTRLRAEAASAIEHPGTVAAFVGRVDLVRRQIRGLLDYAAAQRDRVAIWGTSSEAVALTFAASVRSRDVAYAVDPNAISGNAFLQGTDIPVIAPADAAMLRPDLVLALDDLPAAPAGWEDTPIYAVNDLVDMVHKLAEAPATEAVPGT
jgi:ubiquinone/menaquinone biosynthesis C-methylase UbiE